MLGFSPFKKHANKFNYIPRYYDPEKVVKGKKMKDWFVLTLFFMCE